VTLWDIWAICLSLMRWPGSALLGQCSASSMLIGLSCQAVSAWIHVRREAETSPWPHFDQKLSLTTAMITRSRVPYGNTPRPASPAKFEEPPSSVIPAPAGASPHADREGFEIDLFAGNCPDNPREMCGTSVPVPFGQQFCAVV
jgi:hypothetical protein